MQHVMCCVVRRDSSAINIEFSELRRLSGLISFILISSWPINIQDSKPYISDLLTKLALVCVRMFTNQFLF